MRMALLEIEWSCRKACRVIMCYLMIGRSKIDGILRAAPFQNISVHFEVSHYDHGNQGVELFERVVFIFRYLFCFL